MKRNNIAVEVGIVALLIAIAIGVWAYRSGQTLVSGETLTAIDPANEGINIEVTQPWLTHEAEFIVHRPSKSRDFNRLDVARCLLQSAQYLKDERFERVYLKRSGTRVYYINGDDFARLGTLYRQGEDINNAIALMELPGITHTLNDSIAFAKHSTPLLGHLETATDVNELLGNLMPQE